MFVSVTFIILMSKIQHGNAGYELTQIIETERLKLEASLKSEIAIALKMANSPLIQRYFLNPTSSELQKIAFEEIAGYRKAFTSNSIFWVNDIDKKFFSDELYAYTVDTADTSNYWYMMTLNGEDKYNFNINYNPNLNVTNLWINALVSDNQHKPIGIVGTGINLFDFINNVYQNYSGAAQLYFLKADGEITGASDVALVERKANITEVLNHGAEILAKTKGLKSEEKIEHFETKDKQIIAIGSIPSLNWYITAMCPVEVGNSLRGMTVLFGIMMAIIFAVFVVFNIFVVGMLEPLNRMVKTINQTLFDWELKPNEENSQKDEIRTLGEFLNMTIIDQLTGIYNRRYMDGHLKKIIKSMVRANSNLSLLIIDIDYFKKYNDTYGHDAGDNCLRMVASSLSKCVSRDLDFVARYGGEEFAVVLPNTDKNGAHVIAEKLLEKVRECNMPHKASHIADCVTISVGGTTSIVKHWHRAQDYIKAADKALYESKKNGRNRYTFENFEENTGSV
ncbi:MAG: diguanylate cyclase [Fibromonadales bacterium]|nr:diguanylate cyclase [Fibromonadales bacterium]